MQKPPMVPLIHLFSELKRRRIYPVVVAYTLASWLLLQVGEVIFSPLGFPDWVMTALVISVIAGFPVVMLLAWVFDVHVTPTCDALPAPPEVAEDTPSVAVLPFLDMSAEQDQAYLCEGLAEEIINALTPIPGLHVAARMSSFQYRDRGGDVREIGRQLGVKAVLEGSVRKTGDRLRVTVQLVKVTNGYHLWSRSFDENLVDLFVLQQQIASGIVEAMLVTLTPVKISCCTDVTAYDYYLRGRQFFNRFRKLDMEHAREMFREAMEIDPGFAPAWAGYADCHSFLVMYADPRPCYRDEANRASIKALELDPDSAEAHASRGLAYLVNESFESAESEFKQALALNPSLFEAYYYFGRARFHQGDMASAADLFKKASEVNPADYQSRLLRVQILRGSGNIDLAKAEARQAIYAVEKYLAWNPDDARALHLSAGSLILLGDLDRAERWLQRAIEIDPNDSVVLYNVACNYAVLGRTKEALNYLEQAIRHGTVSTSWLRNDADLKNICDLPRFKELLQELESRDKSGCASQIGDSVLPN